MVVESRFRSLFWSLFGVFVLYGTSMTIIGATLPRILADFHWDYVTAGAVMAAGAVAYFLSTFGAGYLISSVGGKFTVVLGVVLDLVGLTFFGATSDPLTNFLLNFLIGLGQGCIEVSITWAVVRLDTQKTGAPMTFIQGAFAIGAIVGPVILGVLLGAGGAWTLVYRGLAAVFLALGLVLVFLRFDLPPAEKATEGEAKPARLYSHPAYWLAFAVLFLYVGVELGVSSWVSEYFIRSFGLVAATGSILVSLFWFGILVGRFGVPVVLKSWTPGRTLIVFTAIAALFIAALSGLSLAAGQDWARWIGFVAVFGAGLGCSIVYPIVITLVGATFPQAQSQAIGFAATGGGVGAFLFPFVMSLMSQAWGIQWGFAAYAAFAFVMTGSALVLVRVSRH
ncbi:MAG: MFS transporter [Spirochaetales bacterium]